MISGREPEKRRSFNQVWCKQQQADYPGLRIDVFCHVDKVFSIFICAPSGKPAPDLCSRLVSELSGFFSSEVWPEIRSVRIIVPFQQKKPKTKNLSCCWFPLV